jgi:hypothetical protein
MSSTPAVCFDAMFAHLASTLARARANGKAASRGSGNPQYSQTTVPDPPAEGRAPANDGEEMLVTLDDTSPTCWIAEAIAALPTGGGRVHPDTELTPDDVGHIQFEATLSAGALPPPTES